MNEIQRNLCGNQHQTEQQSTFRFEEGNQLQSPMRDARIKQPNNKLGDNQTTH